MSSLAYSLVRYARLEDALAGHDLRARLRGDEARQFNRIADESRRRQWLAGRALARELLREALALTPVDALQILSRSDNDLGTRPQVIVNGRRRHCALSISHTSRGVLAAVATASESSIGVDLCDESENFTPGFQRLWFTPREQSWIQTDGRRAATLWAAKEAVFKAVSNGAPWNPREIEVYPASEADEKAGATRETPIAFACDYRGQAIAPLSLTLRTVDGHTAAIACLARGARVRFSVPIDSFTRTPDGETPGIPVTNRNTNVPPIQAELIVTSVGYSPCWIST